MATIVIGVGLTVAVVGASSAAGVAHRVVARSNLYDSTASRSQSHAGGSTTTALLKLAFATPSRGIGLFVTTKWLNPSGSKTSCVYDTRVTTDGGESFAAPGAPIARTNCETNYPVDGVAIDGPSGVLTYGPGLFVSDDDGASWTVARTHSIVALSAVGKSVWAINATCGRAPSNSDTCQLTLLVSSNRGRTWQMASHQPPMRDVLGDDADFGALVSTWLLRSSAMTADVLLPAPPLPARSSSAILEVTTNGGTSWQVHRASCLARAWSADLSIGADGTMWLACGGEPAVGEQEKSLAQSFNSGRTWVSRGVPCELGTSCSQDMPIGGYLGGLVALSADKAFYVGDRSALTVTRDGGRTWTAEPDFSGSASGTDEVTFVNTRDGWAIDSGFGGHWVLWHTVDGGARWWRILSRLSARAAA